MFWRNGKIQGYKKKTFVFSRIRTEYGEMRSISPYSFRMQENMDQKNSEYGHFLRGNNVISEILVLERKKYTFLVYYLSSGLNKVMMKYRSFNYGILPKSKNAVILRYFIFEPSFKLR